MTLALACSGGGRWCIPQLGFIHALHERGYQTMAASGVSFGSWSAYAAVSHRPFDVLARIKSFCEHVDMDLFKPWASGSFSPWHVVKRFEAALDAVLPARADVRGDLFIMAVTTPRLRSIAFDKAHQLPGILRAAMALPPLPAARYGGLLLRDAALRIKYGIRPLVESGRRKILCLGTYSDGFALRWKAMKAMSVKYRHADVLEWVMPITRKMNPIDFSEAGMEAIDWAFEEGYQAGRRFSERSLTALCNP